MSTIANRLLSLLLAASLAGCSTLRAVPDWPGPRAAGPAGQAALLKAGDRVRVSTRSAPPQELVVGAVEADALVAEPAGPAAARIPFDDIVAVERHEFDALKTVLLVALVTTALIATALSHMAIMPGAP